MIYENLIQNIKLQIELEEQFAQAKANNTNGMPADQMIGHHREKLAQARHDGNAALMERHITALKLLGVTDVCQ